MKDNEGKTYRYDFECENCHRTNIAAIPMGTTWTAYLLSEDPKCIFCGCFL